MWTKSGIVYQNNFSQLDLGSAWIGHFFLDE